MSRRLYRCRENRVIAGVAGGVAEYFDVDPSLVRLFFFLSIFVGGFGILLYIAMAVIVPLEPLPGTALTAHGTDPLRERHRHSPGTGRVTTFLGIGLILLGGLALIHALLPGDWGRYLWPTFVVAIGVLLVAGAVRRDSTVVPRKPTDAGEPPTIQREPTEL